MIGVYVQFANSIYNYGTSINGTIESAREYFIGSTLNFGDRYFGDKDNCQTPIAVDLIPDDMESNVWFEDVFLKSEAGAKMAADLQEAREAGYTAAKEKNDMDSNPHWHSTPHWTAWRVGFERYHTDVADKASSEKYHF